MRNLSDINVIKSVMGKHGVTFNKGLGQNFLVDPEVCPSMAEAAGLDENTCAIEIGPGVGVLTAELAKRAGKVLSFEVDKRLLPVLDETLSDFNNVEIINEDVMKADLPKIIEEKCKGMEIAVVANLPYYITSPILTALLEADCFDSVTVMVQKEVAQRIAARPGTADYSAFSIFCQYYAEPELLFDVPAHCFLPQPKVTSAVIQLRVRKARDWGVEDEDIFFRTVRASFLMRRKKLSNGLASGFPQLGKEGAAQVIEEACFDANVRGETLSIPEFARIANVIARRLRHD